MERDDTLREEIEGNVAGFLLTVGSVTVAFLAVFLLVFDGVVAEILAASVIAIGLVSVIIGMALDLLGYFDGEAKPSSTQRGSSKAAVKTASKPVTPNKPLAPVINFDDELAQLKEAFGDDVPKPVASFAKEYRALKGMSPDSRRTAASNMRATLNPITVLVDGDDELEPLVDDIGDRLFRYIKSDPTDFLSVTDFAFYVDGNKESVRDISGHEARLKATVFNEGEECNAEVVLQFESESGVNVRREYLPVGAVQPNAQKELNTHVYVPSPATQVKLSVVESAPGEPVLDM